jgi:hypothetical protein
MKIYKKSIRKSIQGFFIMRASHRFFECLKINKNKYFIDFEIKFTIMKVNSFDTAVI